MIRNSLIILMLSIVFLTSTGADEGCGRDAVSAGGTKSTTVAVPVQSDGLTTEQSNIKNRLVEDNKVGSIKHLYIISAYSGQTIIYSTVKGKVTSSGKRLTPSTFGGNGFKIKFGDEGWAYTGEVLQDDGSYGSSSEYIYWWDTKGVYHQHYVTGGQIVHISNQPISVKSITINMNSETQD